MPITGYPQGVSSFGFPLVGSGPYVGVGQVFWVNSVTGLDANGRGLDPTRPFKTINFAVTKCKNKNGDFIFVMPGHVELISNAGGASSPSGSISVNISGVSIIGIGTNANRPLIQWNATAGQILVAANDVSFENVVFDLATAVASVVAGISVGVTGTRFNNCRFITSTTAQACLIGVTLTAGWGNCEFNGCTFNSSTGLPFAAGTSQVAVVAGDRLVFRSCFMLGDSSNALIDGAAIIITNVLMEYGEYINVNSGPKGVIKGSNSCTGSLREIMCTTNGGSVTTAIASTGLDSYQCFGKGTRSANAAIAIPGTQLF